MAIMNKPKKLEDAWWNGVLPNDPNPPYDRMAKYQWALECFARARPQGEALAARQVAEAAIAAGVALEGEFNADEWRRWAEGYGATWPASSGDDWEDAEEVKAPWER